jgi:hypothetical protein
MVRSDEDPDNLGTGAASATYRRTVSPRTHLRHRFLPLLAAVMIAAACVLVGPASADEPPSSAGGDDPAASRIEDYADYQPQRRCRPKPRVGTKRLAAHLLARYGGGGGASGRACGSGTSEHYDGRAIDWTLNAARKADRKVARAFLKAAFATDKHGNEHAKARRMGIMYIIWNDTMYGAWDRFEAEPYLASSCRTRRKCAKTLRHRDHVHISLSMAGAKAETSWYDE